MILNIKIDVVDKIEAYRIVSRLGFKHKIISSIFEEKEYIFDDKVENKKIINFLREDFNTKEITIIEK